MKNLISKMLIVLCLATAPILAGADDRFDSRNNFPAVGSGDWRLGDFHGDRRGYEILYRAPGRNRWQLAPGGAMAIADGWVLGTDRHNGGYGIYRWNGRDWSRMPGTGVRIGGSYRQPWVVNERGVRFSWNGFSWREDQRADRNNDRNNDRDRWDRNDRDDRRNDRNNGRYRNDRDDRDSYRDERSDNPNGRWGLNNNGDRRWGVR